jgi:hypothetical protein
MDSGAMRSQCVKTDELAIAAFWLKMTPSEVSNFAQIGRCDRATVPYGKS